MDRNVTIKVNVLIICGLYSDSIYFKMSLYCHYQADNRVFRHNKLRLKMPVHDSSDRAN